MIINYLKRFDHDEMHYDREAEAEEGFRRAIDRDPEAVESHIALGLLLLKRGSFIAGRTLLLCAEQGSGAQIQFLRFVPRLAALGARIFVEAPRGSQDRHRVERQSPPPRESGPLLLARRLRAPGGPAGGPAVQPPVRRRGGGARRAGGSREHRLQLSRPQPC